MRGRRAPPSLAVPEPAATPFSLSSAGTLTEGDVEIGADGLRVDAKADVKGGEAKPRARSKLVKGSGRPVTPRGESKSLSEDKLSEGKAQAKGGGLPDEVSLADLEPLEVLGEGSSGVVQRMRHRPSGGYVALKVVPLDLSPEQRRQILGELRTLHAVRCPQIVGFHGAFLQEGAISMALEYMDAGTLADVVQRVRRVPEGPLAAIARDVLLGLRYLHRERHIVHRDLKPSNLLLNRRGEAKVADFGTSGQLDNSVDVKVSFVGTVTYMAPERVLGSAYSYASDIWSFGIAFFECATGRFPYPPEGSDAVIRSFWDLLEFMQDAPAPRLAPDEFSPELCDFVARCVQKSAEDRATAEELLEHPFIAGAVSSREVGEWVGSWLV